jgi:dTDP-4-amino-4,6-dideoxygalactose transaminase
LRTEFLPYCRPALSEEEIASAVQSFSNGWLTTGPKVREFEEQFARRCGTSAAIALSSCTAAIHVALRAFGVGPGDTVVMPSLTFVAGAQCTLELGATPVFADVDPQTLSVTLETIQAVVRPDTKAIVTMPYAGRPSDVRAIVEFAHARGIRVLEDAAHAAGMLDGGTWSGTHADAAAYSFYATKNLTTAEGGMLVTNDPEIAERARVIGLHGMSKDAWKRYTAAGSWRYDVIEPGFKYNLADPLAAVGIGQLARLDEMQARRDEIANRYIEAFSDLCGVSMQSLPQNPGDVHSWCMFVVMIDEEFAGIGRDAFIEAMTAARIGTAVHYVPTHLFTAYRDLARDPLPQTEHVWEQLVSLPLYPAMTDRDVDDVVDAVTGIVARPLSVT